MAKAAKKQTLGETRLRLTLDLYMIERDLDQLGASIKSMLLGIAEKSTTFVARLHCWLDASLRSIFLKIVTGNAMRYCDARWPPTPIPELSA